MAQVQFRVLHHSRSSVLNNICHLSKQLQAEKGKAAARIDGLEDEIDGLKGRLRKLQDKADREVRVMKSSLVMTSWFLKVSRDQLNFMQLAASA